jgi:hypothetical protein
MNRSAINAIFSSSSTSMLQHKIGALLPAVSGLPVGCAPQSP